jgi:hypothetical protein
MQVLCPNGPPVQDGHACTMYIGCKGRTAASPQHAAKTMPPLHAQMTPTAEGLQHPYNQATADTPTAQP